MAAFDPDRLRHRRQFILGPRPLEEFAHWKTSFVGPHLVVQVHEDLPLVEIEHKGMRITLLGFVIDPLAPEHDDATILREIAEQSTDARQAPRTAAGLSGRWVMIADDGNDLILFHDPCGLREVYHTTWDQPDTWCASQPHRIAGPLGYEVGASQREFYESAYFRDRIEAWMPGPASPYAEVRHLLPNHCLDLRTREVWRYWPYAQLAPTAPEEGARLAAQLLRETLRAANLRFNLALPLTAGRDSRTLLAASRGLDDIWHYTGVWEGLTLDSADIQVARRVLRHVGRPQNVIECPAKATPEFAQIYRENTFRAKDGVAAIAQGLFDGYPAGLVKVSGHCSEVVRDTFGVTHNPDVTVEALADLMGMQRTPFCLDQIDLWFREVRPVADGTGHRIWDLFFMEQEYGVWAANGQSQWDLIHERITPFNSRRIFSVLMGVAPEFRQGPDYPVYRRMMEILWPDVLEEPFNPSGSGVRARSNEVVRKMRRYGVRGSISKGVQKLLPK